MRAVALPLALAAAIALGALLILIVGGALVQLARALEQQTTMLASFDQTLVALKQALVDDDESCPCACHDAFTHDDGYELDDGDS